MAKAPDSTEVDPDGHRIVLENEDVRVLEIRLPERTKLALHSHPARAIIAVSSYTMRSTDQHGNVSIIERRVGETVWVDAEEHSADVLVGPVHAIEVELEGHKVGPS